MLVLTHYRFKPFMGKANAGELMKRFSELGEAPGTVAHYVATDGSGGFTIVDVDDAAAGYRNILNYGEFLEFESHMVLPIDEAVPQIVDYLG